MWSPKQVRFFLILLLIASVLALVKLGLTLYEGNQEYQLEKDNQNKPYMAHELVTPKFPVNMTGYFVTTYTNGTRITSPQNATLIVVYGIMFTSPEVFAVDNNINYTIKASTYPVTNFSHFYIIFNSTHNNIYHKRGDIDSILSYANDTGELIELKKENATYFDKINGNWTDPVEDQISILAILVDDKNHKIRSDSSPIVLTIAPHINKLQADTDLDIQRRNLESIKSDTNVEALTWLIIALIPIGFVIETVIHGFMLRDESSKATMLDGKHIKNLQLDKLNMMDFSEYLLNYTERYFTKVTDLANIILALVAAIGALIAIAFFSPEKNLLPVGASIAILLGLLYAVIKISITNHNKNVYYIEESIFQYSANINKKSREEQLQIFKKLHILFGNRRWGFSSKPSNSEIEQFKQLLSSQPEKTE